MLRAALEGITLPLSCGVCHHGPPPGLPPASPRPPPVSGVSDRRWGVSAGDSGGEKQLRQVSHKQADSHRKWHYFVFKIKELKLSNIFPMGRIITI